MNLRVNQELIIDRYYRGAILFLNGKCYTVDEDMINVVENVLHSKSKYKEISNELDFLIEESIVQILPN